VDRLNLYSLSAPSFMQVDVCGASEHCMTFLHWLYRIWSKSSSRNSAATSRMRLSPWWPTCQHSWRSSCVERWRWVLTM